MLALLREWYAGAVASARARRAENRLVEAVLGGLSMFGDQVIDSDVPLGRGSTVQRPLRRVQRYPLTYSALVEAQRVAVDLFCTNAFARNLVRQVVNHVVGRGFAVRVEDPAGAAAWADAAASMRWSKRRREIVRRVGREGEAILRRFSPGVVRFIEPEQLRATSEAPLGIVTDRDDVESRISYLVGDEVVPAEDVFHFVDPDCDESELRGWPALYDAAGDILSYTDFVNDRGMLNRFRAAIMMFKKYKGAAALSARRLQDAVKSGMLTRPGSSTQSAVSIFQNIGRVIEHPEDIEYEFKNPNVGGTDAAEDGRAIRLLCAVWYSFPEYVTTSDASNANFASTAVAESPGVKAMESWQEWYGAYMERFVPWSLYEQDVGRVTCQFPSVQSRKELESAQARSIRYQNGVLSARTWMELDGVDADAEILRMEGTGP
jgi:hypothetical protein